MTILPEMVVHFDVSRQRSIAAVQEAMAEGQEIFLVTQRSIDTEDPDAEDVFEIGTVAQVRQIIRLPKQILRSWLRENTGDACRRSNIKILTCVRKSR